MNVSTALAQSFVFCRSVKEYDEEGMFVLLLLGVFVYYVQLNFCNSHFKCYLDEQKEWQVQHFDVIIVVFIIS